MKKEMLVMTLCMAISIVLVLMYTYANLEVKVFIIAGLMVPAYTAWKKGLKEFKSLNIINTMNNRLINDIRAIQRKSSKDTTLLSVLTCKG